MQRGAGSEKGSENSKTVKKGWAQTG